MRSYSVFIRTMELMQSCRQKGIPSLCLLGYPFGRLSFAAWCANEILAARNLNGITSSENVNFLSTCEDLKLCWNLNPNLFFFLKFVFFSFYWTSVFVSCKVKLVLLQNIFVIRVLRPLLSGWFYPWTQECTRIYLLSIAFLIIF